MSKVPYLIAQGGYIPGLDHSIPPDVPVRNFLYAEGQEIEKVKG